MRIDVHSHLLPIDYIKELDRRQAWPTKSFRQVQLSPGEKLYNVEVRIKQMDRLGVDIQVLSLTGPGVLLLEPKVGITLAKMVNNRLAKIVEKYPERFVGLATLPLQDVEGTLDELDRAIKDLGLSGVYIFSNVAGKTIDSHEFWPFYEKAAKLDIPIFIHPTNPISIKGMEEYGLVNMIGFPFDTTLATMRLILSGLLERYPTLKIVLAHLGGALPYMTGRIDAQSKIDPECRISISKPPSKYSKLLYLDTVSLHKPSLTCALATQGPEKLLFGSDYPYWDLSSSVEIIRELDITDEDRQKIFYKNARKILKIQ